MKIKKNKTSNRNILVSAVIAAYNEELHISTCIKSLLSQDYKNIEIIIVENGDSTDKTLDIAKYYTKKYKNIKTFSIPGKQNGPGNAWNFGVKKSNGEIILVCGADLIYGKNYIKKGVEELIKSNSLAIIHKEEICSNPENFWARAFFYKRPSEYKNGMSKVFTIVKKEYLEKRPFDSKLGYADDQTIYLKEGTIFPVVNLEVYHTNPSSFKDTWDHSKWVGKSLPYPIISFSILPIFPIYSIYKTIKHLKKDFYFPFIFFLPIYYSIRYFAYFKESFNRLFY